MSNRQGSSQQLFEVVLILESGKKKTAKVVASTRKVAERRAMKRNPAAVSIDRS